MNWGDSDYVDVDDSYLCCVRPSFESQVQWRALEHGNSPLCSTKDKEFCDQLLCFVRGLSSNDLVSYDKYIFKNLKLMYEWA